MQLVSDVCGCSEQPASKSRLAAAAQFKATMVLYTAVAASTSRQFGFRSGKWHFSFSLTLSLSLSSVNAFASSSSSSVAASATFAIDIYRLARERESGGSLSVVRMALAARAGQFTQTLIQSIAFSLLSLSRTLLTNSEYLRENIYSSAELDE